MSFLTDRIAKKIEILAEIDAAIIAIATGGQEYKFNDMQVEQWVKKGDLEALRKYQQELEYQIAASEDTGGFYAS